MTEALLHTRGRHMGGQGTVQCQDPRTESSGCGVDGELGAVGHTERRCGTCAVCVAIRKEGGMCGKERKGKLCCLRPYAVGIASPQGLYLTLCSGIVVVCEIGGETWGSLA